MLISGALMGMGIFAVDMFLRPQFAASQIMELLLFAIEGVVCDLIYGFVSDTRTESGFSNNVTINKSLFAGATIAVCGIDATGATVAIPNQYYVVQVRAVTKDGATKRLQAQKISTGLPSPFDFVFFSGGNIVKN
jgi:hypothetical protein